jgi:ketosteroid isomerase-like protein
LTVDVATPTKTASPEVGRRRVAVSLDENKDLVRRALAADSPEAMDQYYARDYVGHASEGSEEGDYTLADVKKQWFGVILSGFPDAAIRLQSIVAEGDLVASRVVVTGTHTREYLGVPATGKKLRSSEVSIDRIEGGKIVESWGEGGKGFHEQLTGTRAPKVSDMNVPESAKQ